MVGHTFLAARSKARPCAAAGVALSGRRPTGHGLSVHLGKAGSRRRGQPAKGSERSIYQAGGVKPANEERLQILECTGSSVGHGFFQAARMGMAAGREAPVRQT